MAGKDDQPAQAESDAGKTETEVVATENSAETEEGDGQVSAAPPGEPETEVEPSASLESASATGDVDGGDATSAAEASSDAATVSGNGAEEMQLSALEVAAEPGEDDVGAEPAAAPERLSDVGGEPEAADDSAVEVAGAAPGSDGEPDSREADAGGESDGGDAEADGASGVGGDVGARDLSGTGDVSEADAGGESDGGVELGVGAGDGVGDPLPTLTVPVVPSAAEVTLEPKAADDSVVEVAAESPGSDGEADGSEATVDGASGVGVEADAGVGEVSDAAGDVSGTGDVSELGSGGRSDGGVELGVGAGDGVGDPLPTLTVPVVPSAAEVTLEPKAADEAGAAASVEPDSGGQVVGPQALAPSVDAPTAPDVEVPAGPEVDAPAGPEVGIPAAPEPAVVPARTVPERIPLPLRRHLPLSEGPDGRPQFTTSAFLVLVSLAAVGLFVVLVAVWAIDSVVHSGQVNRNVAVAGHAVGGNSEDELAGVIAELADQAGERPVEVVVDGEPVGDEVMAASLGLAVDQDAAKEAAIDAGRGSLLGQPFSWWGSLFNDRTVELSYTVDDASLALTLGGLYGDSVANPNEVVPASNPRIELVDGAFAVVPGESGTGLDLGAASEDLTAAAEASGDPFGDIVLDITTSELAPTFSDAQAEALADEANALTESGVTIVASDAESSTEQSLSAERLRGWITPVVDPAGAGEMADAEADIDELSLHFDSAAADAAVIELFAEIGEDPSNASVTLAEGEIQIIESSAGVACCEGDVGEDLWEALSAGESTLEVEAKIVQPERSTEDVEAWGIIEPVGGSRGWQGGAEVEQGPRPGYTTWEVGGGGRAHNIELMTAEINGTVIPPGGSWSINDHVGARACPPYQAAGAIVEGEIANVCGGGTSQVATTLLNAAYFAGLDVTGVAHSQYFSRYPRAREATMGAPGTPLDVRITNNTDYGVYIQGARHGQEVTFTIWSTQHIEVEDLGVDRVGTCVTITNTRQRTFPDGRVETDEFTAVYRPGSGQFCGG